MSKIFGDVLSSSSYNAKESIDAIKSSVANLKVEIESVGVTGKGLGLNDVMNACELIETQSFKPSEGRKIFGCTWNIDQNQQVLCH